MLPKKLKQNLSNYSEYKQQQTLHLLQNIKIPHPSTQQTIIYFNEQLENIIQCGFYDIICNDNVTDLCSLLHLLCLVIKKNQWVRINGVLFLVGSAVQILEGRKLRLVLEVFQREIRGVQDVCQNDRHKLHRIINEGLKKLQKSKQNQILRGKLHMLMTNILKIAHKSGLNFSPLAPQHLSPQQPTLQQYTTIYSKQNVPYKTYISYCHIYNRLQSDIMLTKQINTDAQSVQKYWLYEVNSFLSDLQVLLQRFYQVTAVHVKQADIGASLYPAPLNVIKFVDDAEFRVLVLVDIVMFIRGFMGKVNGNVGFKVQAIQDIKFIVDKIQASCLNYIKYQILLEEPNQNLTVLDVLGYFQSNQKKWLQIKSGNLKNIIKLFAPSEKLEINKIPSTNCSSVSQPERSMQMVTQVSQQASTIAEHELAYRSEVLTKLGITNSKMQKFLSAAPVLNIKKQATDTSFLYYVAGQIIPSQFIIDLTQRQARQDLTDFDNQDYTIIRWKAMRSLMKEKLPAVTDPNFCRLFKDRRNLNKDFKSYQQTEVE